MLCAVCIMSKLIKVQRYGYTGQHSGLVGVGLVSINPNRIDYVIHSGEYCHIHIGGLNDDDHLTIKESDFNLKFTTF